MRSPRRVGRPTSLQRRSAPTVVQLNLPNLHLQRLDERLQTFLIDQERIADPWRVRLPDVEPAHLQLVAGDGPVCCFDTDRLKVYAREVLRCFHAIDVAMLPWRANAYLTVQAVGFARSDWRASRTATIWWAMKRSRSSFWGSTLRGWVSRTQRVPMAYPLETLSGAAA